ncbi:MAG: CusA/CzcA family heavy metal efflux RND transporter, partial [Flavobacteriaceae bacterium]|nr:CusA/CzcA family heavy metal efflux RND transporter [Flavobacteriaceae bacterium]
RFDLAIRLDKNNRTGISSLENLYIDSPTGIKVPLHELATISQTKGPAKISRDDTKRRIVVGINVRNRDLQSVVDDIQKLIETNIKLPVGYSITYGGQFENLQNAKARLKVAVPIALVLIFFLLYFAFNSVSEALMIYSAIPLSAVGGVFLLWIRDLPFSISAGVGFIALFGIAVLNGIVLIEHFKELKEEGMDDLNERIIKGAKERLRPVILTAAAAALGFLPMAISTNAGAEVQRPLATVVIGGLVSATLLTMLVLPVLYSIFDKKRETKKRKKANIKIIGFLAIFLSLTMQSKAQEVNPLSLDQVYSLALENNAGLKASSLKVDEADALVGNAFSFDKTEIYYNYDESNLAVNNEALRVFGVTQDFLFPTIYFAGKKLNKATYEMESSSYKIKKKILERELISSYYQLQYELEKEDVYRRLDSFYKTFAYAAKRRFETGETNYLEKITAQAKQKQLQTVYKQSQEDVGSALIGLQQIVQSDNEFTVKPKSLEKIELLSIAVDENLGLAYFENKKSLFQAKNSYEKQKLLPDISLNYFQGTNSNLNYNLTGYQIGLKIPILFSGNASKIKASKIAQEIVVKQAEDYKIRLNAKQIQLLSQLRKYEEAILYYDEEGKTLSEEIFKTANFSYKNGEIDFFQYILSLDNAFEILLTYLDNLNLYNQTVIKINYLTL